MKKIIISIILLAVAGFSIFSYRKYATECKKVDFAEILNKEFIYFDKDKKTDITIAFSNDGIFGFGGVNRYFAGYKLGENGQIAFSPIGSTMMAGPQEKMELERQYFDLLNNVNKIETYKSKIVLLTKNNQKLIFKENTKKTNVKDDSHEVMGPKTKIENVELKKDGSMKVDSVSNEDTK